LLDKLRGVIRGKRTGCVGKGGKAGWFTLVGFKRGRWVAQEKELGDFIADSRPKQTGRLCEERPPGGGGALSKKEIQKGGRGHAGFPHTL